MSNMSRDIPIEDIRPNPRQPRKHFVGIEELAESLKGKGQLTPILVRPISGGYELVHGERRWRAAQLAGLPTLRAEVRELSDTEAYHLALIENLQRDDLTPIEEADAYQSLQADGMTQADIGKLVGKGQSYVAQKLRLLKAPRPLKILLARGALTEGHMRQLLKLKNMYPTDAKKTFLKSQPPSHEIGTDPIRVRVTLFLWNWLRPEEEPFTTLAMFPEKHLTDSKHFEALVESALSVGTDWGFVSKPLNEEWQIPAWMIGAWWWGCCAVLYRVSVADLANKLSLWHERLASALLYRILHPDEPKNCAGAYSRKQASHWWGADADLRHAGWTDLEAGMASLQDWPVYSKLIAQGWIYPSILQWDQAKGDHEVDRDGDPAEAYVDYGDGGSA